MSETIAIKLSGTGAPDFLATLDTISDSLHISDQREIKLAMWLGEEVVFPSVDYAGISADPHAEKPEVFLIPGARVPELAGERWTAIDERQGLIEDFGNDWPALVAAARAFETTT